MKPKPVLKLGQKSWHLRHDRAEAWVTETGGHLAPARFKLGRRVVSPLHVSPWHSEKLAPSTPAVLRVLRGDFFCLPFGMNEQPWRGETHPVHGESANARWRLRDLSRSGETLSAHLELPTHVRAGRIEKIIQLRKGETALYQRHVISGMRGPINFGHHATLRFRSEGRLSFSPIRHGQVYPGRFEEPSRGGYPCLKPGAIFRSPERVPLANGGHTDLTRYPAREGFEDVAMVCSKATDSFGWSAVTFAQEGWVWFALKDPRVLPSTLLWHSNGGRHYPPWSGRHRAVLGVEEICSYFQEGIASSLAENSISRRGIPTSASLPPGGSLTINYIMAVAAIPVKFDRVADITPVPGGVRLTAESGNTVDAPLDLSFLSLPPGKMR